MNLRPIQPSDAAGYENILLRTSPQDRYCRFFHVVDHFSRAEVNRFVNLDSTMLGYIATEDDGVPLGTVHAFLSNGDTAEFAIVVAADARRRGVGKALLAHLVAELRARGFRHLVGYALADNHALGNLAKAVGMHSPGVEATVRTWSLDEAETPSTDAAGDHATRISS